MTATSSKPPAVILDASLLIGYCANESAKVAKARTELRKYALNGWEFFSPGVAFTETLFILCKKLREGIISPVEHSAAMQKLEIIANVIKSAPNGEGALVARAEDLRRSYGCGRTNDSMYLALAEQLAADRTAEIVTFDNGMKSHANATLPSLQVNLQVPDRATQP